MTIYDKVTIEGVDYYCAGFEDYTELPLRGHADAAYVPDRRGTVVLTGIAYRSDRGWLQNAAEETFPASADRVRHVDVELPPK